MKVKKLLNTIFVMKKLTIFAATLLSLTACTSLIASSKVTFMISNEYSESKDIAVAGNAFFHLHPQ